MTSHIRAKDISVAELLEAHLHRVEQINPLINAVVSLDEDRARSRARELDRALAAEEPRSRQPLFGLPIAIKDTHNTAGMLTTWGSPAKKDHVPTSNDLHVQRIEDAGAIIFGKTNVPEYAAGSHTFNRLFGATRNPYNTERSAGGSSGGAAAALASGFNPVADGSDMGGSLRNPASFCNVVGLRPTPGLVPNAEGPNIFNPLVTAGPMARTVRDAGLLLSVIAQPSALHPTGFPTETSRFIDIQSAELAGLRVAWAPTLGGMVPVAPEVLRVLEAQLRVFEAAGAHIEEACMDLNGSQEAFTTIRAAEFYTAWAEEQSINPDAFNSFVTWNIHQGKNLTAADQTRAYNEMTRLVRQTARFFDSYDVLLAPVAQVAPFPVEWDYPREINGEKQENYLEWMRAAYLFTPLGIPGISVPAGFTESGLPVGVQMLTAHNTDARLLSIARAYEERTNYAQIHPAF
ncbi:amidase family protein [Lysinibacter sp. HNR]|uniref:amidase n=1 Tax=Lysinibacter sp. HNR TaxID=3031408 RepID=UPI00243575ED|nr:amidase family protein [Lysinibacter sp. HNR]WGD37806.1 amidase family protein [Lysinibacter sp. HNR]